jgi:hypothetical protein
MVIIFAFQKILLPKTKQALVNQKNKKRNKTTSLRTIL